MDKLIKDIKNESGIYEILNIKNNKRYIGQSQKVRARLQKHRRLLIKNEHQNLHLQNSFNKYGINNFVFNVIEYCSLDDLNKKEKYYIYKFNSNDKNYGYNYRLDNTSNRGLKWTETQREKFYQSMNNNPWYRNHKIPEETLKKAWEASRNKQWTDEEKQRHSEILKGTKVKDTSKMKIAQAGEKNGYAKLKECDVKEIIYLLYKHIKPKIIAKIYMTTISNISAIRCKRSWKFLDREKIVHDKFIIDNAERKLKYYEKNINE